MLMDMSLLKFGIYQDTGAKNCFKSHTNSSCPHIFRFYRTTCLNLYSGLRQSHEFSRNEQIHMVFTAEEFSEVAMESWSE